MAEQRGLKPGETRDAAGAVEPGTVSRLLLEIARASEEAASSWRESLRSGDTVGRYQIRREIGRGGFGAVYEAFDPELGRTVALKALKPGRTRRIFSEEWIRKEAEAVAKLDHPAIVTIFDVGTCPAGAYLVMELLQGETLADRLANGPLSIDEALRIAEQMAEGLAHAHERGVLHRDLKPANVFVCEVGQVKLLDFGLAHLLGTDGSSGAGTPAYMAPEQAAGEQVDGRADVYAAAMVLGELLTGERPVAPATPRGPSPRPPSSRTERIWEERKPPAPDRVPGEAPHLDGMPRPVARILRAALSVNPEERPKDGGTWLAELRSARLRKDRPRRARRVALLAGIGVAIGLAAAGFATWRVWERQIPGGRPTVAVADFANETGEADLDSVSGLLITALEQGTQLRVLTRGRMLDVLRQLGKGDVTRIDEALAREVGKETRASALLLATVRRLGASYVVEMRALDPLHDEYIFTVSEQAPGKEAIFAVVDRLGAATRRRLGEPGPQGAAPPRAVASITTRSVKAWDLLSRSRTALHEARVEEARALVDAALAEDPDFALAHYQAAIISLSGMDEYPRPPFPELEAALRLADRLPEKERVSLRAMKAQLDGRWEDAQRLRDQAADAYPLDKEAQYYAGDVRYHQVEVREAIPYFRRAVRLDPGYRLAATHLADALMISGLAREELPLLREQVALARTPLELRHLGDALLAGGDEEAATSAYRRASKEDGAPWPPAQWLSYLVFSGRAPEGERQARDLLHRHPVKPSPPRPPADVQRIQALGTSLVAQGRLADWRAEVGTLQPGPEQENWRRFLSAVVAGDAGGLRTAVEERERLPGFDRAAPTLAWQAAAVGAVDVAAPLSRSALEGPGGSTMWIVDRKLHAAVVAWGAGDLDGGLRELSGLADRPHVDEQYEALVLTGHLRRARREWGEAADAYDRALRLPWTPLASLRVAPRARILHALALCHEKSGDVAKARARNDELLRLWAKADPDAPLLAEAKALQARLAVK